MEEKKMKRRFAVQGILLCVFGTVFVISLGLTMFVLVSRHKAMEVARKVQITARENVIDGGLNVLGETSPEVLRPEEIVSEDAPGAADILKAQPRHISMDFTELKKENSDIIGWLYSEGTKIDYPVLQTDDNSYYMNHLFSGETNASGSLFADYRNNGNFSDKNTVIYGHHMRNGTMFGSIEAYREQEFYDAAPSMMLYTPEGDYLIELISGTDESGNEQFVEFDFEDEETFTDYIDSFRERSSFQSKVKVHPGDRLISLCTCTYVFNNARYMLIGRLVPLYDAK